jgi:hypothetical protein
MSNDGDRDRPKPKDFWDKLSVIGAPLIAAAGLWFTFSYNSHQDAQKTFQALQQQQQQKDETAYKRDFDRNQLNLQRLETVEKLYSELVSAEVTRRETAIKLIKNSGDDQLATRVAEVFSKPNTPNAALEDVFAKPTTAPIPAPPSSATVQAGGRKEIQGWAYLGDFSDGHWKSRYFEFDPAVTPASLQGSSQVVSEEKGALNVRSGMPTLFGAFPDVVDVLPPKTQVKILSVKPWVTSSYQWAYIQYAPTKR